MKLNSAIRMVVRHLRNAFEISVERGGFTISDGEIALSEKYIIGEWIAITGSTLNNGIYKIVNVNGSLYWLGNGTDDAIVCVKNEEFNGAVWRLRLPQDLIDVSKDIAEWQESPAGKPSNVVSESVVGFYSKTLATNEDGAPATWESVFSSRLHGNWRKMFQSTLISSL